MIGAPVFLPDLLGEEQIQAEALLLKRLNEPDAFDTPIAFEPKEQLEIVLHNHSEEEGKRMEFIFLYKGKKWVIDDSGPFEHQGEYHELANSNNHKP
jgi:hypothetical protein